jgi:hypothetical protein
MPVTVEGRWPVAATSSPVRMAFLAARESETIDELVTRCRSGIRAVATAQGAPDK